MCRKTNLFKLGFIKNIQEEFKSSDRRHSNLDHKIYNFQTKKQPVFTLMKTQKLV